MLKERFTRAHCFIILFLFFALALAGASKPGKGYARGHQYRVEEPGIILLLGASLISLGLYARRKRRTK
jgi:hypothetical protein